MSNQKTIDKTNPNPSEINTKFKIDTLDDGRFVRNRRSNVKSDLIEITEDKLENILLKHLNKMLIRKSWITPFTLLVTIVLVLISATFKDKFGVASSVWEAIFIVGTIISVGWLLFTVRKIYSNYKFSSIDDLILVIKDSKRE